MYIPPDPMISIDVSHSKWPEMIGLNPSEHWRGNRGLKPYLGKNWVSFLDFPWNDVSFQQKNSRCSQQNHSIPIDFSSNFRKTISGWWLTYPSEKYEFVSWDDDIPNIWKNKIHVPNQIYYNFCCLNILWKIFQPCSKPATSCILSQQTNPLNHGTRHRWFP